MTNVPFLVTGPTLPPVSIVDVKKHLRVDIFDEDDVIEALIYAQTAYLDGYNGVLGRAIMPQTWAQEWSDGAMECLIAMPDATISAVKVDGTAITTANYSTEKTAQGTVLTLENVSGEVFRVEYSCQLPGNKLSLAKMLICLMVGDAFENRAGGSNAQQAIDRCISALRWGGI